MTECAPGTMLYEAGLYILLARYSDYQEEKHPGFFARLATMSNEDYEDMVTIIINDVQENIIGYLLREGCAISDDDISNASVHWWEDFVERVDRKAGHVSPEGGSA